MTKKKYNLEMLLKQKEDIDFKIERLLAQKLLVETGIRRAKEQESKDSQNQVSKENS